jgi:hypothetical protein
VLFHHSCFTLAFIVTMGAILELGRIWPVLALLGGAAALCILLAYRECWDPWMARDLAALSRRLTGSCRQANAAGLTL